MEFEVKNKEEELYNIEKSRQYLVTKSNNIIQNAKFNFTAQEIDIISYLVSKIKLDDTEFKEEVFDIGDFCRIAGIADAGTNYKTVKDAIIKLREKSIWVQIDETRWSTLSCIDCAEIDTEKKTLTTKLSNSLKPFLLQIKGSFTSYQLDLTLSLKGKYSKRLYEILKSWLYVGKFKIEVEKLKEQLFCKNYKTWQNFKARVLEIAYNEINEYSDLNFSFTVTKTKCKYTHIEFFITEKPKYLPHLLAEQKRKERLNNSLSPNK
jgi:plasmid replication initiation protein